MSLMSRGNQACRGFRTRMLFIRELVGRGCQRLLNHLNMSSGVSLTCPQQVVRVELVEFRERDDKRKRAELGL